MQDQATYNAQRVAERADSGTYGRDRQAIKRTKGGRYLAEITKEELLQLQHLPIDAAAEKLGVGTTSLKVRCREVGIKKWPFRDLQRAVSKVERSKKRDHQHVQQPPSQYQAQYIPMTSQPDPSHSTDAVRGLLGHLITPAARTPSPTTTQTATAAYLSMRQQYGEQIALQMLFDQYGAALASMPSEMAGMLQMYGVDATAVIRAVQEFAVQTIANVLACAEQRMQAPGAPMMLQTGYLMQRDPMVSPSLAASSMPPLPPALQDEMSPKRAMQHVQVSLDSLMGMPLMMSGGRDCSLHNDVFQAAITQLSLCGDFSGGDIHAYAPGAMVEPPRGM